MGTTPPQQPVNKDQTVVLRILPPVYKKTKKRRRGLWAWSWQPSVEVSGSCIVSASDVGAGANLATIVMPSWLPLASASRSKETPEQAATRKSKEVARAIANRLKETSQETTTRRSQQTVKTIENRLNETSEEAAARRFDNAARSRANRAEETPQQTTESNENNRVRKNAQRTSLNSAAAEQRERGPGTAYYWKWLIMRNTDGLPLLTKQ